MENEKISIHAPVKGATFHDDCGDRDGQYFNPRTREGCDQIGVENMGIIKISIHAPVKGATRFVPAQPSCPFRFQSTHP